MSAVLRKLPVTLFIFALIFLLGLIGHFSPAR
jgi:hypothetical protein